MATRDVVGTPHSIIRHPDMPRAVFKLLWDTIASGKEIFAYVKNMSKSGKYYWVLAHVTPSYNAKGELDGYHSNRRKPQEKAVKVVEALYASLLAEEKKHDNAKTGQDASVAMLMKLLSDQNLSYSEFVWSVGE
jgi:PAS domain-containing protein